MSGFLSGLDDAIAKAQEFAAAVHDAEAALVDLGVTGGAAGTAIADAMDRASAGARNTGAAFAAAGPAVSSMNTRAGNLAGKIDGALIPSLIALDDELDRKEKAFLAAAAAAAALGGALDVPAIRGAAAAAGTAGVAAGVAAGFWARWGNIIHWVVMGTLEIAATAIPAMVALGAAVAGMYPTFAAIKDQMSALVTASGGLHGALLNSVGPLHQLGLNFGALSHSMQPDAMIIFGAAINSLSGHFGAFSRIAQQAGNVLAAFATKLSTELSGPLGSQLTAFFADSVKFMIQWGQVLGNLGHAFVNMATSMWGTAKILLDVLVAISHALVVITSNPVGAWFIGLAFAMSAAYRYGRLLMGIWGWLTGSALVTGIRNLIAGFGAVNVAEDATIANTMALGAAFDTVIATVTALSVVLGIAAAAYLAYYIVTNMVSKSTRDLIAHVQAQAPTFTNLTDGIVKLSGALQRQQQQTRQSTSGWNMLLNSLTPGGFIGFASAAKTANVLTQAIDKQKAELYNLITAQAQTAARTGSVGAGMAAQAIQTRLADDQVQQLNQNLDQYISLLTGGTAGMAQFSQSLANIGSVAGTTANNLGTASTMSLLSAKQFAAALSSFRGQGAGAWTNFDQVISSIQSLMDWMRQAADLGAMSGAQVRKGALDAAAAIMKYAGANRDARATILGLLRAQGLNFPTWAKLQQAVKAQSAGQADLTKKVDAATIAYSHLSKMAQDAATILSQQVTAAITKGAAASSGLNAALAKLQTDMANHAPQAQIQADIANVNKAFQLAATQAAQTATAIQAGSLKSAQAVQNSSKAQQAAFQSAQAKAQAYQQFLNSMHGPPTIHVNTVYTTSGGGPAGSIPGHAAGTGSARRGLAVVGERGPELVMMQGGEQVIPAHHTKALLRLAGAVSGTVTGYQAGTQSSGQLMSQLTRELAVLAQRVLAAASIAGISQYIHNLLSTIKQLASVGKISHGEESRLVTLIGHDNKRLDTLFRERASILAKIKKADQYAAAVSQTAQTSASLGTIMSGLGAGPVSSSYLLATMKIDLAQIRRFDSDIKKLEKLGLDRALLNQIIQMGPAQGDQVAQALINGPLSNIKALNATESQVQKASRHLGRSTAEHMFDAGKNAGKGFLSGLKSQEHQIEKLMQHIAQSLVATLKKELGIHSPSTVARQIGRDFLDGIPLGVGDRMPSLDSSLRTAAGHVASALGSAAGRGGGGGGDIVVHNHIMVPLPGARQQYTEVQTQTLRVNRRNPDNRLSIPRGRGR